MLAIEPAVLSIAQFIAVLAAVLVVTMRQIPPPAG